MKFLQVATVKYFQSREMGELTDTYPFERFSRHSMIITVLLTLFYFSWFYFSIGIRPDHIGFFFGILVGYYAHPVSRRFVLGLSIFILYTFLYDSHKIIPNYVVNPVHLEEPYLLEIALFGITTPEGVLTPSQYFQINTHPFLDVITGLFYLCWMPVPILLASFFTFTNRVILFQFSLAFMTVNLIGWTIYYLYPAAAPWYIDLYGFTENYGIPGHVAGLGRFDEFFGITLFEDLYTKASNVFAAIPSLHSAYPVVAFVYGLKARLGWFNYFLALVMVGIWFAAVYTNHHYIIDVALGVAVAVLGIFVFEKFLLKTKLKEIIEKWAKAI